jgi:SAM-dependent methyltransferase
MAYFDHFAKSRSTKIGNFFSQLLIRKEHKLILNYLGANKNIQILEIGPGKGSLAKLFIAGGYKNYDIVEPNSLMRKKLQNFGIRKAKNYLIPKLKEKSASYDAIICCDVFEHLNNGQDAQLFISEAQRVLKRAGIITILSPDYLDWGRDFYNCDFSHNHPTTVRRTTQLFSNYGIECLCYKYTYSFLSGFWGELVHLLIKGFLFYVKGNNINSKVYKLKLNFLRRFIIVGKKN